MLILAINTATPSVSAALWQDGRLLSEETGHFGRPHAETLLPLVVELLHGQNLGIPDIGAFACAIGPGSYTGIRIGVSTVMGMAYAAGKPAYGISTLEALAWPYMAVTGHFLCPVLDARGGRVYSSAWRDGECVIPEANREAADLLDQLQKIAAAAQQSSNEKILLIGDSDPVLAAARNAGVPAEPAAAPVSCREPRAACIAEIAGIRIAAGLPGPAQELAPRYLSLSQAERLHGCRYE
jgi:tRNA threonylcarbamoyladenosine biosynthesis protein TsaB